MNRSFARASLAAAFSGIVSATMVVAPQASAASELPTKTKDGVIYRAISNKPSDGMEVVGYEGPHHAVVRGHITKGGTTWTVKRIGKNAFAGSDITKVTLPNTIKKIGEASFIGTNLNRLVLPHSVRRIDNSAFISSTVKSVRWSNKLESIGEAAFISSDLESADFPDSLKVIGEAAFISAPLTSVTFGKSLKTIGNAAFLGTNLRKITIPGSVKSIGNSAFVGSGLTKVTFKPGLKKLGTAAFADNELSSVGLPKTLRTIGDSAFAANELVKVTIPAGVTSIGEEAFANETLELLRFRGLPEFDNPESIGGPSTTIRYESDADHSVASNGFTRGTWFGYPSFMFPEVTVKAPRTIKDGGKVTLKILVRAGDEKIQNGEVKVSFGGVTKTFTIASPFSLKKFSVPNVSGSGKTFTAKAVYQGFAGDFLLKNKGVKKIKVVE